MTRSARLRAEARKRNAQRMRERAMIAVAKTERVCWEAREMLDGRRPEMAPSREP